ncbi:unnamed protein product [Peniophora sp. CBMAI 1063]|nr:unnamed protein product [Peniophora sp. CBMAI 1063]
MTDIRLSLLRNKHRASDYAPLADNPDSRPRAGSNSRSHSNSTSRASRMLGNMKRRYSRDDEHDEGARLLADEEATEERIEIGPISRSPSSSSSKKSKGARTFAPGTPTPCAPNVVRNQQYTTRTARTGPPAGMLKFFLNLYFLLVALSQFVPALKFGFIATYVAPHVVGAVMTPTTSTRRYSTPSRDWTTSTRYASYPPQLYDWAICSCWRRMRAFRPTCPSSVPAT